MKNRELIEKLKQFPLDAEVTADLEEYEEYRLVGAPEIVGVVQDLSGEIEIQIG